MPNFAPSLTMQNKSVGMDLAIGQIDLIGASGEVVKSWRIRKPRCSIGSSPDCSVQLNAPEVAALHATLVFGKKHTLLRSVGPTLISNRHVREWLIDETTEIVIGGSRLVVHPSNCILANVVHAENLIDRASRLSQEQTPVNLPSIQVNSDSSLPPSSHPESSKIQRLDPIATERLDSIEKLLESLKLSLEKMQTSIGLEAKSSSESIVQSVTLEIDEFGKRLFTDLNSLNKQISNQTEVQESLISGIADQFTGRLGAIDEQLNRFYESSTFQTSTLNEMLAQATADQQQIETRFQEVFAHRNELMDAVQILRTEILLASDPANQSGKVYAEYADSSPANTDYTYAESNSISSSDVQADAHSVTDEQLAHSLEIAQVQIQELNLQLRQLEMERDAAEQRIASLESQEPPPEIFESPSIAGLTYEELDRTYGELDALNRTSDLDKAPLESSPEEATYATKDQEPDVEEPKDPKFQIRELPSWFRQDEVVQPPSHEALPYSSEVTFSPLTYSAGLNNSDSFSPPDLSAYSEANFSVESYEQDSLTQSDNISQEPALPIESERVDSNLGDYNSNLENLDSISDRLQRMLADADQRRTPANSNSKPRTSHSWSERFNATAANPTSEEFAEDRNQDISERLGVGPSELVDETIEEDREPSQEAYPDEPVDPLVRNFQSVEEIEERVDSQSAKASDEEESIEAYMQRLLNRVRGEADNSPMPIPSKSPVVEAPVQPIQTPTTKPRSRVAASMGLEMEESLPPVSERLSEELFVPRQQAPEQRNDLAALRELANTNARRAITRSDLRRTNSAFFLKLGVTALAVFSAVALFLFNGFTLNAPFAGMIAAVVVAILWGFDCVNHFRLLKNVGQNQATPAETAAGQSIRVGNSSDESGWRPTPA